MFAVGSVSLTWIASFLAVVDHGTFTAAAASTHKTQPRVTAHVASLERALGVVLLERGRRSVRLTVAGEVYLPHARAVVRDVRHGFAAVEAIAQDLDGRVRVGSYPGAMAMIIAPLVQRFRAAHPGVELTLTEADPASLEALVAAGELDLAIRTAEVPQQHRELTSSRLFDEHVMLIVGHGHPLARSAVVDPRALADETVIVSGTPAAGWSDYRDRLDRMAITPRSVITVVQPTTMVALVREGIGVGLLGSLAAAVTVQPSETVAIELPAPEWRRQIRLYRHLGQASLPALDAFVDLLHRDGPTLTAGRALW